jgi:integrase
MKINFKLKDSRKNISHIVCEVYYTDGRLKCSTGESIEPQFWNKQKKRATEKNYPKGQSINSVLNGFEAIFVTALAIAKANQQPLEKTHLSRLFENYRNAITPMSDNAKPTFFSYLQNFIDTPRLFKGERIQQRSMTTYKELHKKLEYFAKQQKVSIDFSTLNLAMLEKFTSFLYGQNLNPSTVGKYLSKLKTVLNDAKKNGIEVCYNYNDAQKPKPVENTAIYLTENELMHLFNFDLSNEPRLETVRDIFVFQSYTAMRYSDIKAFKRENYDDTAKTIQYITTKTGTPVIIPIFPIVQNILNKYGGMLPNVISEQKANEYLKEIGQKVGLTGKVPRTIYEYGFKKNVILEKWQMISTHTARRTGATNMYKATGNARMIMQITGHKKETTFWNYVRLTNEEHAANFAAMAEKTGFGQIYEPENLSKKHLKIA